MAGLPHTEKPRAEAPGESVILEPWQRLCLCIERITARIAQLHPATIEDLSQMSEAVRLLKQLATFITPPGPELTREELQKGAEVLARFVSPKEAQQAYFEAGDFPRGRPVRRRFVAALAVEAKRANPHLSRVELARKFCPCEKTTHDQTCAERLRRDMT